MWMGFSLLLLVPLVAMRFTGEVRWSGSDFAAAGLLLAALGVAVELICRLPLRKGQRLALLLLAAGATGLVWAGGAVGIW